MSYHQSGKAMLSVEKDGDSLYASAIILSGLTDAGPYAEAWFHQSIHELAVYCDWLPNQCRHMQPGDKMIFKVTFEQHYYKGTWGFDDDDEDLIFTSAVKLYHKHGDTESRRSRKKYYQTKQKSR